MPGSQEREALGSSDLLWGTFHSSWREATRSRGMCSIAFAAGLSTLHRGRTSLCLIPLLSSRRGVLRSLTLRAGDLPPLGHLQARFDLLRYVGWCRGLTNPSPVPVSWRLEPWAWLRGLGLRSALPLSSKPLIFLCLRPSSVKKETMPPTPSGCLGSEHLWELPRMGLPHTRSDAWCHSPVLSPVLPCWILLSHSPALLWSGCITPLCLSVLSCTVGRVPAPLDCCEVCIGQ